MRIIGQLRCFSDILATKVETRNKRCRRLLCSGPSTRNREAAFCDTSCSGPFTRNREAAMIAFDVSRAKTTDEEPPMIVYAPGLTSVRDGEKGQALKQFAKEHGFDCTTMDHYGHGESAGSISDARFGISHALNDLHEVIQKTQRSQEQKLVLCGASFGAYLSIRLVEKEPYKQRLMAILAIGGAYALPDLVNHLPKDPSTGSLIVPAHEPGIQPYTLHSAFAEDAKTCPKMDDLAKSIMDVPILIVHGANDNIVPMTLVERFCEIRGKPDLLVIDGDNGDHRLNKPLPQIMESFSSFLQDLPLNK